MLHKFSSNHKNQPKLCLYSTVFIFFFYIICLNYTEMFIITPTNFTKIKVRFDDNFDWSSFVPQKISNQRKSNVFTEDFTFDQELVTFVVNDKLILLKEILRNENENIEMDPLNLVIRNPAYSLNVSFDSIHILGLKDFSIADVSINAKSKQVGALLRFPELRVVMYYRINGSFWDRSFNDTGIVTYKMNHWRTTMSGKVANLSNRTKLELEGFVMRSRYQHFDVQLESFFHKQNTHKLSKIFKLISKNLMTKIIDSVDGKLEAVMLERLDVSEAFSWESLSNRKSLQNSDRRGKRQVPCEMGEELDEYVDSLFNFVRRLVRVMEPFNTPNVTIELEEYNLQIFLHSGRATRTYSFRRKKPAWVLCTNETTTLGLTVGIDDLRLNYKYRVIKDWRLLFDGDLEAQVKRTKAQVQITQLNEQENDDGEEAMPVQQRIDKLKVWSPGQVTVLIRGLGNLSSSLSMILNKMLNDPENLAQLINTIETSGLDAANEMLKNVTIPIFSII